MDFFVHLEIDQCIEPQQKDYEKLVAQFER